MQLIQEGQFKQFVYIASQLPQFKQCPHVDPLIYQSSFTSQKVLVQTVNHNFPYFNFYFLFQHFQYIFSNKMQQSRFPLSIKLNEISQSKSPLRPKNKVQSCISPDKLRTQVASNGFEKNSTLSQYYKQKEFNPKHKYVKHIQSEIIYDNEIQNHQTQLKSNPKSFRKDERDKLRNQDQRKFNAKHFQIESKINKIHSYHQKIEGLLQIVNIRTRTPSKIPEHKEYLMPSRSLSKISTPNSTSLNDKRKTPERKFYQQKFQLNNISEFRPQTGEVKGEKQVYLKVRQKDRNQRIRKNQQLRNQKELEERNRNKSKQYMRSIQGQVRNIQSTIQVLNEKIKQTQHISFRKQVNFANLSEINPESAIEPKNLHKVNHVKSSSTYCNPYQASSQVSEERNLFRAEDYNMKRQAYRRSIAKQFFVDKRINQNQQKQRNQNQQKQQNYGLFDKNNVSFKKTGAIYNYKYEM